MMQAFRRGFTRMLQVENPPPFKMLLILEHLRRSEDALLERE